LDHDRSVEKRAADNRRTEGGSAAAGATLAELARSYDASKATISRLTT
jgi:hypothetical protein